MRSAIVASVAPSVTDHPAAGGDPSVQPQPTGGHERVDRGGGERRRDLEPAPQQLNRYPWIERPVSVKRVDVGEDSALAARAAPRATSPCRQRRTRQRRARPIDVCDIARRAAESDGERREADAVPDGFVQQATEPLDGDRCRRATVAARRGAYGSVTTPPPIVLSGATLAEDETIAGAQNHGRVEREARGEGRASLGFARRRRAPRPRSCRRGSEPRFATVARARRSAPT